MLRFCVEMQSCEAAQAGLELTLKFRLTSNSLPSPSRPPSARFHSMYELPGLARSAFSHSLWGA